MHRNSNVEKFIRTKINKQHPEEYCLLSSVLRLNLLTTEKMMDSLNWSAIIVVFFNCLKSNRRVKAALVKARYNFTDSPIRNA